MWGPSPGLTSEFLLSQHQWEQVETLKQLFCPIRRTLVALLHATTSRLLSWNRCSWLVLYCYDRALRIRPSDPNIFTGVFAIRVLENERKNSLLNLYYLKPRYLPSHYAGLAYLGEGPPAPASFVAVGGGEPKADGGERRSCWRGQIRSFKNSLWFVISWRIVCNLQQPKLSPDWWKAAYRRSGIDEEALK